MKRLLSFLLLLSVFCTVDAQQESGTPNIDKQEITDKSISQLNILFNKTYRKAEAELLETGTFIPFGAIVGTSGKVNFIHVNNEANAEPEKTVRAIQSTMIDLAKKKEIFASAIYYMTKNLETTEGILNKALIGRLEHATGVALAIATEVSVSGKTVNYSPPLTSQVPSEVFYWVYEDATSNTGNPNETPLHEPNQSLVK